MNYLGSNPVKIITRTKNLFNKKYVHKSDFVNCTEIELLDDKNVMIARGKSSESTQVYNYALGWVVPLYVNSKTKSIPLRAGDIITVSADITLIEDGGRGTKVRCYILDTVGNSNIQPSNEKSISETTQRLSWKLTVKADSNYRPVFPINSNKVRIENIAIKLGEDATYEPYNQLWRVRSGALIRNPKNLIPFPYDGTIAPAGITFNVNNDGTITANGKNDGTRTSVCFLARGLILPAGTYTARVSAPTRNVYFIIVIDGKYQFARSDNPVVISSKEPIIITGLYIQVDKGMSYVFENAEIRATLYEGTGDEPYHIQD